ncbi:hypothetical protein GCM10022377_22220 [Zhihengliuella alba]|uniref:Uncharacterized protein n=1 Tax=Zhihengliuella alba TaxID=547018 RepID=A0ABP7DP59_9MICC
MAGIEERTDRPGPARARRLGAVLAAAVAGGLVVAACAGPDASEASPETRPTASSSVPAVPEPPDASAWPRVDHGFLSFPQPPGWTVAEQPGAPVGELRDETGEAVAYLSTEPFAADTGDMVRYGHVQEMLRIPVDTGADQEQVLLGFVAGPSAEPGVGRGLALRLLSPEAADRLVETGEQSLRFDLAGDEQGVFFSADGFVRLDGEAVAAPDDEQIARFMETDRFRRLVAVMAGVRR